MFEVIGSAQETNGSDLILIYPNPAEEKVFVQLAVAVKGPVKISIYDISGNMVYTKVFAATENISINISGLVPGFYQLVAHHDNRIIGLEKLIVGNRIN